jgi:hypothetical protein
MYLLVVLVVLVVVVVFAVQQTLYIVRHYYAPLQSIMP